LVYTDQINPLFIHLLCVTNEMKGRSDAGISKE